MGLLDLILGQSNPISQWADTHPGTLGAIGGGLGSGNTFAQGLANTAQMLPQGKASDVQLGLAIQGRNATADWLQSQPNPNLQAMASLVRTGQMAGADAMKAAFAPGTSFAPGATVAPNPLSPSYTGPSAGPAAPPDQTVVPPNAPAPSGPLPSPAQPQPVPIGGPPTRDGTVPVPLAPVQTAPNGPPLGQGSAPQGAPPQLPPAPVYNPGQTFTAPTGDPMQMTPAARQTLGRSQGLSGPALASFVVSGKVPPEVAQAGEFAPATAADRAAAGIGSTDPQVYQKNTVTGELKAVPGALAAPGANGSTPPAGTTGKPIIDPTVPGYSSQVVVGGLTQAAIDQKALANITAGTQPQIGRTGIAGAQQVAISNRMAELDPNGNLAANKAQLSALTQSLATQQKYSDTVERSVNNAEAGFSQVVNAFKGKVNASQYPNVNAAMNAVAAQLSPGAISAYQAGLAEVANEYTQVFSRGGQATDAVRAKSASIANGNLSLPDLQGVLTELQAQGKIVVGSSQAQVAKISSQINNIAQTGSPAPTQSPATRSQPSATPITATGPNGAKIMVQNGQWVDATTGKPVQ